MQISAYFPDVSWNYHFENHTAFQDRDLKSKNVTFQDRFNGEYEKHIKKATRTSKKKRKKKKKK